MTDAQRTLSRLKRVAAILRDDAVRATDRHRADEILALCKMLDVQLERPHDV
jgi:hypothetical protein